MAPMSMCEKCMAFVGLVRSQFGVEITPVCNATTIVFYAPKEIVDYTHGIAFIHTRKEVHTDGRQILPRM